MKGRVYDFGSQREVRNEIAGPKVTLPAGLSLLPPCKPRGSDRPLAEIVAAYMLASDMAGLDGADTVIQGSSLRDYSSQFEWGKNGHKHVANLAEKLGLAYHFDNRQKVTVWYPKTQQKTQRFGAMTRLQGLEKPSKKPSSRKPGDSTVENPAKNPAKNPAFWGYDSVTGSRKTQQKTQQKPSPPESDPQKPSTIEEPCGFAPDEKPSSSRGRAGHVHVHVNVLNKNKEHKHKHEHKGVQFTSDEERVFQVVTESFKNIGQRVPPAFIRKWFDLIGLDQFVKLWDHIRVTTYEVDVRKPVSYIGAAVQKVAQGSWEWIPGRQTSISFCWMPPIAEDLAAVKLPLEESLEDAKNREIERFATNAGLDPARTKSVFWELYFKNEAACIDALVEAMLSKGSLTPEDMESYRAVVLEDFREQLSGPNDPLLEALAKTEILLDYGLKI